MRTPQFMLTSKLYLKSFLSEYFDLNSGLLFLCLSNISKELEKDHRLFYFSLVLALLHFYSLIISQLSVLRYHHQAKHLRNQRFKPCHFANLQAFSRIFKEVTIFLTYERNSIHFGFRIIFDFQFLAISPLKYLECLVSTCFKLDYFC